MCGIAGAISFDPARPLRRHAADVAARVFNAGLACRGPDGEGTFRRGLDDTGPGVVLAHRRLAVIDPTPASAQPFVADGARLAVVFNGEIFNYRDLRRELAGSWDFTTAGDTEVLLAAYATWGEACAERLDGMFAFAVYDARGDEPHVFLARDPAGEKPLFVLRDGDLWAFASELAPLRRAAATLGWGDVSISGDALRDYLAWGYVPGSASIHKGVRKLPPGCCLTIGRGRAVRRRYFDAGGRFEEHAPQRHESVVTRTRGLVAAAVQKRLVSDVPLGCLLSGGIDSSVVALHMRRALGPGVRAFTIGFGGRGSKGYDETPHAAEVARHLGLDHHVLHVTPGSLDVVGDLTRLAAALGEPFGDASILPTRVLAEFARRHVTVALGGDGGDEAFGGYDRYRALALGERARRSRWARAALRLAATPAALLGTGLLGEKNHLRRAARLADGLTQPAGVRYAAYTRLFPRQTLKWLTPAHGGGLSPAVVSRDEPGRAGGLWFDAFLRGPGRLAAAACALDRATYLPGDLLVKVDRASMLHGLEVRSPLVDRDLLRFAASLCDAELLGGGSKRLLREAFAAALPAAVFRRRKRGFAVPIGAWLRGPLRPLVRDALFSADSLASEWFDPTAVRLLEEAHAAGRADHGHKLFALLMLELWWHDARRDLRAAAAVPLG